MSKLYQLIQSEYKFEYITEYVKPEGLMDKKNFSTPQIYPKIISQKHLNAFSELEKQQILDKYKRSLNSPRPVRLGSFYFGIIFVHLYPK